MDQGIEDAEIIEDTGSPVELDSSGLPTNPKVTAILSQAAKEAIGASKRKKGCQTHKVNPAGSKLARKLERQGSLYGRQSLVAEVMSEIQVRKFKEARV